MPQRPVGAPPKLGRWDLLAVPSLVALAWLVYIPSLKGPFVFDDPNSITQSELVRSITPLWRFVVLSTRPLTDFSFAVDFAVGGLDSRAFHGTNILLHALNAVLVFLLARQTLALPSMKARYPTAHVAIAWVAAALFAVHPLNSETVAYISSRSEVLVSFFLLLVVNAYVFAATAAAGLLRLGAICALPLLTAAGLATKELAATVPALLLVYDWCFLAEGRLRRNLGESALRGVALGAATGLVVFAAASALGLDDPGSVAMRLAVVGGIALGFGVAALVPLQRWKLIGIACLPFAAGFAYLLYRVLSPTGLGDYGASAGLTFDRYSWTTYLLTQVGVILHYLRLVVVPTGLNFDHDTRLVTSVFSPEVIVPLLILVGLTVFALARIRRQPVLPWAVLWMFVILAPTSSVLPLADVTVEHRMYLPLVGFTVLAATLAWDLIAWAAARTSLSPVPALFALAAVPLLVLGIATSGRAAIWGDAVALHRDAVAKAPENPRARLNLGVIYLNLQRLPEAERELTEAKRLYDRGESIHAFARIGAFIHYNLGAVLYLQGQYEEAAPQLERALEIGGQYLALRPMALYLLSRISYAEKDWTTAAERIEEAIRYNKFHSGWFVELANMQLRRHRPGLAKKALVQGLQHHPGDPELEKALASLTKSRPRAGAGES